MRGIILFFLLFRELQAPNLPQVDLAVVLEVESDAVNEVALEAIVEDGLDLFVAEFHGLPGLTFLVQLVVHQVDGGKRTDDVPHSILESEKKEIKKYGVCVFF